MISVRAHLPGYRRLRLLRNASIRTGVYAGVCLSIVLLAWIILANRVPFLERFALERNLAAAALFALVALVPVLRFSRMPGPLLASSLIGWAILSLAYRALCLYFLGLNDRYSAVQVFMLGAVAYMILVTLSWLGTIISRARGSHASHPNHHAS